MIRRTVRSGIVTFPTFRRLRDKRLAKNRDCHFHGRMDEMPTIGEDKKSSFDIAHVWRAFRYSMAGLGGALRHEDAFKQELAIAIVLIPASFFLNVGWPMRTMMILSVLAVLLVELLNSAIEAAIDYISKDRHPLAKRAKDMGSAAVFVSLLSCCFVWLVAILMSFGIVD